MAENVLIGANTARPETRWRIVFPSLSLGISERRLLLGIVDGVALNAALLLTLRVHHASAAPNGWLSPVSAHPEWFLLLTLLWLIIAAMFDGYQLWLAANPFASSYAIIKALATTVLAYWLIPSFSPWPAPRLAGLLLFLFAACLLVSWRIFYAVVFVQPIFRRRALIVGTGEAGIALARTLQTEATSDCLACGFIDDDPAKQGTTVAGVPVVGAGKDLLAIARREGMCDVILAITNVDAMDEALFRAVLDCHEQGIRVATMPDVYEGVSGRVAVEHIGRGLHLILPVYLSPTQRIYEAVKRLLDLIGAIVGLTVFALLLPGIVVAIKLDSRGPVFYTQERVGQGGRVFRIFKLRSMIDGAEQRGQAVWATAFDPRITRVGRILRKTRLDELPQLMNVLKGEMSLVGPRPERPQFVADLSAHIPFYRARHAVKPGITGWAQVKYRYGNCVEDALVKLQYDLYYIKHRSLYLDLLILAKTVLVMVSLKGM